MNRITFSAIMATHLGIDYGRKRCGMAISDSLGMISSAYKSVQNTDLEKELLRIVPEKKISVIVIGKPIRLHGEESDLAEEVTQLSKKLEKLFPEVEICTYDERLTSKMASQSLIEMGASKKDRQKKENTDVISAVIILRDYLEWKNHQNNRHA